MIAGGIAMKAEIEIARLQERDVERAAEVLARAFFDDPLGIYVAPDESQRAGALSAVYEVGTRYAYLFGEAYTTGGHVEGAALWTAPESGDFTPERMAAAGIEKASAALGPEGFDRFMKLTIHLGRLRTAAMPSAHWFLMILGVKPPRQGMGIGSQLMQPVLKRADAFGVDCYLETMKARNVVFYEKHGFQVREEGNVPDNGPHYWTMWRRARRKDSGSGPGRFQAA
jgi:GNAT superfamily N-acetyltransferase